MSIQSEPNDELPSVTIGPVRIFVRVCALNFMLIIEKNAIRIVKNVFMFMYFECGRNLDKKNQILIKK
jgi:hypothetical protein